MQTFAIDHSRTYHSNAVIPDRATPYCQKRAQRLRMGVHSRATADLQRALLNETFSLAEDRLLVAFFIRAEEDRQAMRRCVITMGRPKVFRHVRSALLLLLLFLFSPLEESLFSCRGYAWLCAVPHERSL